MGGVGIFIIIFVSILIAWVSHLVSTKTYRLFADKNRGIAITVRILTFMACVFIIVGALWLLIVSQIILSR